MSTKTEPKIYRAVLLASPLTGSKAVEIEAFLLAWRQGTRLEVNQARQEQGSFVSRIKKAGDPRPRSAELLRTAVGQMCEAQVREALKGWNAGLEQRVAKMIQRTEMNKELRHRLHSLNVQHAWGGRKRDFYYGSGKNKKLLTSEDVLIYRSLVRQAKKRIRFPNLDHLWPKLDQRVVNLSSSKSSVAFPFWLRLATLQKGHRIDLPLAQNAWFQKQLASSDGLAKTIQLIPRHELGQR